MAGIKGKTNNPNGRPPKSRALTDSLTKEFNKTYEFEGKKISGKVLVARLVTKAIVTGKFKFPDDTEESVISIRDWIEFVKWVYERIDGKPPQPMDVTSNGETINVTLKTEDD
jgi:hypothetical protein